jgi:BirA family biotin operon repressor/biotin-[acetyl-CoA-carboxylase] ligase
LAAWAKPGRGERASGNGFERIVIGRPIIRLDSVTSTQDVAFHLAEHGAPEGTTVVAQHQTGGRGRAGRTWETAPGDALMFSVVLRPRIPIDRLTPFSILVADAIADALGRLYSLSPFIKWPNDVLVEGRKVSGILIQVRSGVAVVGVGINLLASPPELLDVATSIQRETDVVPDPDAVLWEVLPGIECRYQSLIEGDLTGDVARISERLWLRGRESTLQDADREIVGIVRGVAPNGALLLDTPEGLKSIVSGELVRGPRATLP